MRDRMQSGCLFAVAALGESMSVLHELEVDQGAASGLNERQVGGF